MTSILAYQTAHARIDDMRASAERARQRRRQRRPSPRRERVALRAVARRLRLA